MQPEDWKKVHATTSLPKLVLSTFQSDQCTFLCPRIEATTQEASEVPFFLVFEYYGVT